MNYPETNFIVALDIFWLKIKLGLILLDPNMAWSSPSQNKNQLAGSRRIVKKLANKLSFLNLKNKKVARNIRTTPNIAKKTPRFIL